MANTSAALERMQEILTKTYGNEFDRAVDISKLLAETDRREWPMVLRLIETTPRPVAEHPMPAVLNDKQQREFTLHLDRRLAAVTSCIVRVEAIPGGDYTVADFLEERLHDVSPAERTVLLYAWMGSSPLPLNTVTVRSRTPGAAGETSSWSVGGWSSALRDHLVGK